ncbi:serine protease [Serendipita sp. 411]|nr:serine protease [Serendipita sp. 398]KAG8822910.1 serine protease [Serendipita sp. 401]KAG8830881.1 serine protease [Serendipita sp. 400]KAG8847205.1 serine protease [Serendipita sp. 411]KAG8862050.1 serine protease [Serendipita sp. 405]
MPLAPVVAPSTPHLINNSYIIMLRPDVDSQAMLMHFDFLESAHAEDPLDAEGEGGIKHVYDGPRSKGYAGSFSDKTVERIRAQPEVDYIEMDQVVWASSMDTQKGAPWGLSRISHRPKLRFSTLGKYEYDSDGGDGVDVYVIDTGINIHHEEFEGRAKWGKTMPANDVDEDGNGHGTHCAGTIASRRYGVAKKANVIAVKVLGSNGSGSMSDVVGGVVWASAEAAKAAAKARAEYIATGYTTHKGSVANMSLGGGKSRALDDAVNAAVDNGMHFAVAAGNDNRDACNYSPAGAEKAVTVGASTIGDDRAYFSNWGTCVDVFAPGLSILSTWIGSKSATNTISGTSMASPHTAGLLAYYLSLYPSKSFDPKTSTINFDVVAEFSTVATSEYPIAGISSVVSVLKKLMPGWFAKDITAESMLAYEPAYDVAAVPETLSPKQLKAAVLNIATSDALSDLPKGTPNLLIFNNATTSY